MFRNSRQIAIAALCLQCFFSGCSQGFNKATTGAVGGAALGSGLGAIIGSQTGHAGPGIAIGAAAGALGGALIGNSLDNVDEQNRQLGSRLDQQQQELEENRRLIEELKRRGTDAYSSSRGVVVNLPDVLFEFNRADLTQPARRTVREIADVARSTAGRDIAVEGHTDSVGSDSYNRGLSERRAVSVARELEFNGIEHGKLIVHGFGESSPIATNDTTAGRARNRRVEVIIKNRN